MYSITPPKVESFILKESLSFKTLFDLPSVPLEVWVAGLDEAKLWNVDNTYSSTVHLIVGFNSSTLKHEAYVAETSNSFGSTLKLLSKTVSFKEWDKKTVQCFIIRCVDEYSSDFRKLVAVNLSEQLRKKRVNVISEPVIVPRSVRNSWEHTQLKASSVVGTVLFVRDNLPVQVVAKTPTKHVPVTRKKATATTTER